jgi:hypothetical protein
MGSVRWIGPKPAALILARGGSVCTEEEIAEGTSINCKSALFSLRKFTDRELPDCSYQMASLCGQ